MIWIWDVSLTNFKFCGKHRDGIGCNQNMIGRTQFEWSWLSSMFVVKSIALFQPEELISYQAEDGIPDHGPLEGRGLKVGSNDQVNVCHVCVQLSKLINVLWKKNENGFNQFQWLCIDSWLSRSWQLGGLVQVVRLVVPLRCKACKLYDPLSYQLLVKKEHLFDSS